jgi:hypothetical protein
VATDAECYNRNMSELVSECRFQMHWHEVDGTPIAADPNHPRSIDVLRPSTLSPNQHVRVNPIFMDADGGELVPSGPVRVPDAFPTACPHSQVGIPCYGPNVVEDQRVVTGLSPYFGGREKLTPAKRAAPLAFVEA